MQKKDPCLLGAHTSIAGGVENALLEGAGIEATTIQMFTANQRRWEVKALSSESIANWEKALATTGIQKVMSHDSYLINLGSPNPEMLIKSRIAFLEELKRCHQLHISFLNFHPGAALDETVESCLDRISESIIQMEDMINSGSTKLLLEATAGQGSAVGWRFEELAYIIEKVHKRVPIGVCIDTCHIFVAGYDIRDQKAWDQTLSEFEKIVGLKYLEAFHMNDSMKGLGSRVDRHQHLGKGMIGLECFKIMMNHPKLKNIPKYLETPEGPVLWKEEIKLLRSFVG